MSEAEAADLAQALAAAFPQDVEAQPPSFGTAVVKVRPNALPTVARRLREEGFELLLDVGGVDYLGRRPAEERFEVVYHLLDLGRRRRLRLRVPVGEAEPRVPSVSSIWPAANWAEREVFDLFGIRFEGHPNLRRILMPDDWEGHPLRKDYPLRGPQRTPAAQALRSRFFPVRRDPQETAAPAGGGLSPWLPAGAGAGEEGGAERA